jgi:O-antigen/teichoic acid export membrane protein
MFRLVAKNFSIVTLGQVAAAAIAIGWVAFAARALGPTEFGTFILVGAYVRLVSLTVNAGLGPIAFRELARHREDPLELFEDIVSLRLALGVAGYVVLLGSLLILNEDHELLTLVAISAVTLLLDGLNESYAAYYTARERVAIPSAVSVAAAALSAAAGAAVLLAGFGLLVLIVTEVLISLAVTMAWTLFFHIRVLAFAIRVRISAWWRLIALAVPFAPIHIGQQLNRVLNVILLGRLSGPTGEQSVGYYGPAQSIINSVVSLVVSLRRVLIPPVTARLAQGHDMTQELDLASKVVFALFALPLLLGTSFMAPQLISLLFGEHYAPSAMALLILGWAGALQIAAIAPEAFLFSHPQHKMQHYVAGALVSVSINAFLCILFIREYGITGAAAGAVAGRLVYFLYLSRYCRQQLGRSALQLRQFGDSAVLMAAGFGVWHLMFAVLENPWLAGVTASALTLPLIAGFLLWLRMRAAPRLSGRLH